MARPTSSTELFGARLLREIGDEEKSLEDLLNDLRTRHDPSPFRTGIPELDALCHAHGSKTLAISGRGLPLLYHLVDHLITTLHGTIALFDLEARFSPSHLTCELQHVHVFRPTRRNLKATLESLEGYMLCGEHGSGGREWVGTIFNGGTAGAGLGTGGGLEVSLGWRGWLRVERDEVGAFVKGSSVEECIGERGMRQEVVDQMGWRGFSELGSYCWK